MNIKEAKILIDEEYKKAVPDEDKLIELYRYVAQHDKDGEALAEIGGIYYGNRKFDLALKYYELALEYGCKTIHSGLGYIWYYGRTGITDYEKAFYHFSEASKLFVYKNKKNDVNKSFYAIEAKAKVADMYKNGYFVEKDTDKYKEIIRELYSLTKRYIFPEIFTRMASILEEEGNIKEATEIRWVAVDCLAHRLKYNQFFGEYNRMKWCIEDIYRTNPFNEEDMQFYDLYHVLKRPVIVRFVYDEKEYQVKSLLENDEIIIYFEDEWYRNIDEFMQKATIDEYPLAVIAEEMYGWQIEYEN